MSVVHDILELARWAPSGDNEQPWRFEMVSDSRFLVHPRDTSDWCVYDLDGAASLLAVGALLETIAVAASGFGFRADFSRHAGTTGKSPVIEVTLNLEPAQATSPLFPFIRQRVTQRRPLKTTPLSPQDKTQLEKSLGEGYRVVWIEGQGPRWRMARLLFRSAYIRLTTPEAYRVHRQNIEWGARFSKDRIPDQAVGVDSLTLVIMKWALASWERVRILNRFFAGTVLPRLQMDLLPGYRCAAHFAILANRPLATRDDYLDGGRAVQRFWLTATSLDLQFQPEMTPLIFARYVHQGRHFTDTPRAIARAEEIAADLSGLLGDGARTDHRVFLGRLGKGNTPKARSVRLELSELFNLERVRNEACITQKSEKQATVRPQTR